MMALEDPAEPISGEAVEAFEPGEKLPELPSRAMIHRFLDQQAQEIAIRSQELQIRQLEVKAGYRFSRASLDAQQTDLKDKRSEERRNAGTSSSSWGS